MNSWAPRASPMILLAWSFAASSGSSGFLWKSEKSGPPQKTRPARTFENTDLPSRPLLSHNHSVTLREMANSICDTLRGSGYQALLVGGCVRDLLLGLEPADYDVTTDATPEQVVRLFPESVAVGAQFGVILIPRDGCKVEVATFRSDVGYSDGRHPDRVVYSKTPQEDVVDFVDGQADLEAKVIRAIGEPDRRFAEDKLRMMRAVRFAARFGFEIEAATFRAVRRHVEEIHQVSPERLREELTKLLTEGAAKRAFELLDETWLLERVLPEIGAMKGVQQPSQYHPEGDVWIHTLMMLEGLPAGTRPTLAWGVLLHDVGKPPTFQSAAETGDRIRFNNHVAVGVRMAEAICRRLRFSNEDTEQILALVDNHMKFGAVEEMRTSTLKKFVRLPRFEEHLALHRLDCLASHGHFDSYEFVRRFLAETPPERVRPERLLTGDDLQDMGFRPGPRFSEILEALEDAQLEGEIKTRAEAEGFVLERFAPKERQG